MKIIGITGNSGSGKSTISKLISKNYEAKIIDADKIAKEMAKNNGEYLQAIRQAFGNDVIKNNELDRKKLADIVFLNRAEKEKLDGLTFEYVVEEIKKELEEKNIKIEIFKADVSKREEASKLVDYAIEKYKKIDVLINNAGISQERLFTDINDEEWNEIIDVNLNSVYYCTKAVIPYMIQRKSGCIINISSIWGVTGGSCEVGYSTSKAAIIGFSKALAKEMGPSNIRINCIAPGIIDTDMNKNLNENDIESIKEEIPLNRIGVSTDIAKCAKWLIEDNYTTGQVININGGWYI